MFLKDCVSQDAMLIGHEDFGLCEISVAEILAAGATRVSYEPDGGYGHCGVWGLTGSRAAVRRAIAIACRIVIMPGFARRPR